MRGATFLTFFSVTFLFRYLSFPLPFFSVSFFQLLPSKATFIQSFHTECLLVLVLVLLLLRLLRLLLLLLLAKSLLLLLLLHRRGLLRLQEQDPLRGRRRLPTVGGMPCYLLLQPNL